MKNHLVIKGDCLIELKKLIEKNIKVDCIIADLPYGMTNNVWDKKIDLKKMWNLLNQIKKDKNTPIILFADFPFSIELINSNFSYYRYTWYWNKVIATGFLNVAYQPLKTIEHIHVFIEEPYKQILSNQSHKKYDRIAQFYPQLEKTNVNIKNGRLASNFGTTYEKNKNGTTYKEVKEKYATQFYKSGLNILRKKNNERYPKNLLEFQKIKPNGKDKNHATEKPLKLLEYLIKTYSKENDVILDFVAGSGVTSMASINLNRKSISIEMSEEWINHISQRLAKNLYSKNLLDDIEFINFQWKNIDWYNKQLPIFYYKLKK